MSFEIKKATLGDFLNFKNGKKSPERADNASFPVFGSNGLIGRAESTNCPENTIVIGRVGSYCGSVHFSKEKCWVSDNAISCSSKNAGEEHFWFYVLTKLNLNQFSSGSGQPLLNQATLNAVECEVPNNSPLRALIGSVLNDYDKKIKLNAATNQTLEEMAQAIFKSWFVDFDPVKAKMNGEQPEGMDEATASLFPEKLVESELGLIPEGWPVGKLSELIKFANGKSGKKSDSGQFPLYGANGIIGFSEEAKFEDAVIIGRVGAYCGAIEYCNSQFWASDNTIVATAKGGKAQLPFVLYLLKFLDLNQHAGGAAQPLLNQKVLNSLEVPIPSESVLVKYGELLSTMLDKITSNNEENHSLESLRDTLLPKLLSGEIDL
ncbi:restriction endonuclease subunit S [Vibrio parahaemolyticus]|nr:restriction endonuclease subunit S [Vibrio parahaemolyticus]MDF5263648.1 restriction endonuclease subunit S [Vibrio parahaemolyticus]MDF5268375.1 restriction endonuclease subunit S [Vibrio parahaemolyticus]